MELIFILLIFVLGFGLGNIYASFKFVRALKDAAEAAGIDLDKELEKKENPEKTVHKLAVEKHGDVLYLFDREQDNFICQGSSVQELAQLAKKYKNIVMATAIYNDKVFMFQNGHSKEYTG